MSASVRDLIFATISFVLACTIGWVAFGYPVGSSYFPRTLAVLMASLAAGFGLRIWLGRDKAEPLGVPADFKGAMTAFGSVAAYVIGLKLLGYEITTFLFLSLLITGLGRVSLLRASIIAISVTAVLWGIFFVLLAVPRPEGLFF
jgi:putative tricarboxylic transport membrane protein